MLQAYKTQCKLMGSDFELCIVDTNQNKAQKFLDKGILEIKRIENLLTEFSEDSITSKINANAGISSIKIPEEVFQLLQRCQHISKLSSGYFDITVGPLKKLYRFKNTEFEFPLKKEIRNTLNKVGFTQLVLDPNQPTAFLKKGGMHLSFAAIGKGYAADMVKKLWLSHGVTSGYINASGDLTAFGHNTDGNLWKIGISNPNDSNKTLLYLPMQNSCIATSGDYEQHFIYNKTKYSHNINPKTGLPIIGIKSVSVISPSAELSDALATAVSTMGTQKGLNFINQLPQTHAIIIDEKNNVSFSKHLEYESVH